VSTRLVVVVVEDGDAAVAVDPGRDP